MTDRQKAAEAAWKAAWDVMAKNPTDATRAAYLAAHKAREAAYEEPRSLTKAELAVVRAYAKLHGRTWKDALRNDWMYARQPGILQALRNDPAWGLRGLRDFRLDLS